MIHAINDNHADSSFDQDAEALGRRSSTDDRFAESDTPALSDPARFAGWYYGEDWHEYSALFFSMRENERRALSFTQEEAERSDFATRLQLFSDKKNAFFHVSLHDPQAIEDAWKKDNPTKTYHPTYARGRSQSARILLAFWVDIDIQGSVHTSANLPPTLVDAMSLLDRFPLPASLVWHTGNGVQAVWMLREPWVLSADPDRCEAQTLARRFIESFDVLAQRSGWRVDPTHDLARVLRLPGTMNWKQPATPLLVRILCDNHESRYNLSDFEPYLIDVSKAAHKAKDREQTGNGNAQAQYTEEERTAILLELRDALRVIPANAYGDWIKVGMGLHYVDPGELGFGLFESWSATCPEKYTPEACHKKWMSFHSREDGITEKTLFDLAIKYGWRAQTGKGNDPGNEKADSHQARSESPRPLRRQLPDASPYPVDKLLELAPVAKALHATIQAPLALCGQSVLAATSLAVQGYADIHLDGRVLPLSEYFITVGESGERKTAVDREVLRPHRDYEKRLAEQYEQDRQNYENDLAAYRKARDEALKKAKTREEKKKALDQIGSAPLEPLWPVLSTEEPTYEGLIKLLLHGHPSLGLFADEAGRFIGGYGMSDEHQLKTAAGLSELWDGKRVSRVRGGDGATLLYGRRVALHLMAQPQVAQRVLNNTQLIDQGLMSRCLVTWPESTAGTRQYKETNLQEDPRLKTYSQKITGILTSPLLVAKEKRNELSPRSLPLSVEAKALWMRFHNAVEKRLADNQPFSSIRGFANKAAEHALRLAGILTLYGDLRAVEITTEAMKAGIALAQHYLDEALRLFHASHTDPDLLLAEKLLAWAQQPGKQHLPLVDIYQRGLNAIRDAATARRLVKILEAHGWFVPIPGGMEVEGQFRREVWEVKQKEEE